MSSKKKCWNPNHQYLWIWPYLETGSLQMQSIKGSHTGLGWALNPMSGVLIRRSYEVSFGHFYVKDFRIPMSSINFPLCLLRVLSLWMAKLQILTKIKQWSWGIVYVALHLKWFSTTSWVWPIRLIWMHLKIKSIPSGGKKKEDPWRHTDTQSHRGEGHVKTEIEKWVMHLQAKEHHGLPTTTRS